MKLEKRRFLMVSSDILIVFFIGLILLGFFFEIPTWFVYGAGAAAFICIAFRLFFLQNIQKAHKRAGKTFFPKTDKFRPLMRIIQGILLILVGINRFTLPVSLTPTFASKYASNDVFGIVAITVGLIIMFYGEQVNPRMTEQGLFDFAGVFYPWEEVGHFTWEAYAKRLIFHLKGKGYRKVVFENITQEMQLEITPYLEQHLKYTQNVSK